MAEFMQGIGFSQARGVPAGDGYGPCSRHKDLYDLVNKRGNVPTAGRLLLDSGAPRGDAEAGHLICKWVNAKQMLAGCLAKEYLRAGDYLRFLLQSRACQLTEDTMTDRRSMPERASARGRSQDYLSSPEVSSASAPCRKLVPARRHDFPEDVAKVSIYRICLHLHRPSGRPWR